MQALFRRFQRFRKLLPPSPSPDGLRPLTIVTGGSEGIGKAIATEFAKAGHELLLVARHESILRETAQGLEKDWGVRAHIFPQDLTEPDAGERLMAAIAALGCYPYILVNDAGVGLAGPFIKRDRAEALHLLDLNVRALTDLTHRVLPHMIQRRQGGVLNVASLGGLIPGPYQAVYYASKAYVISFSEALAFELMGTGVRVSALAPGPVATRFHRRMGAASAYYRKVVGVMSARAVAKSAYRGFLFRLPLIVPGPLNMFYAIALKFIPHILLMPFLAWILKRRLIRNADGGDS